MQKIALFIFIKKDSAQFFIFPPENSTFLFRRRPSQNMTVRGKKILGMPPHRKPDKNELISFFGLKL